MVFAGDYPCPPMAAWIGILEQWRGDPVFQGVRNPAARVARRAWRWTISDSASTRFGVKRMFIFNQIVIRRLPICSESKEA